MKKILIGFVLCTFFVFGLFGCTENNKNTDVIRIHIRANSNDIEDQKIKLCVRDKVVDYITPLISDCKDSNDVKIVLTSNLNNIQKVADKVLSDGGFSYNSNAKINNEYFPSREYNGIVFPADYYDALIINLGSGEGNNWWCVAYPPLCFVGYETDSNKIEYRSKIVELINKYFGDK